MIRFVRQQLASAVKTKDNSLPEQPSYTLQPNVRLALADLLKESGQSNSTELGNICLEIFKDSRSNTTDKAAALIDDNHSRLVQALIYERFGQRFNREDELRDNAVVLMQSEINGTSAGPLEKELSAMIANQTEDRNIRALAAAVLDISKISDPEQRKTELAEVHRIWQTYKQQQKSKLEFADSYSKYLLAKIASTNEQPVSLVAVADTPGTTDNGALERERLRATLTLAQLSSAGLISLNSNNTEHSTDSLHHLVYDSLLQSLSIIDSKDDTSANDNDRDEQKKIGSLDALDRIAIFQSINQLSANIANLDDRQKIEFRKKIIDILNLPDSNEDDDRYADVPGSNDLRILAMKNVKKIFQEASDDERNQLTAVLKNNIESTLTSSENNEDGIVNLGPAKRELVKEAIKYLTELSSNTSIDGSDKSQQKTALSNDIFKLFIRLSSATSNSRFNPKASEIVDTDVKIYALQALNSMRSLNRPDNVKLLTLCSEVLATEKDSAIREEAESMKRLEMPLKPVAEKDQYTQAKQDIESGDKQIDLKSIETYIALYFSDGYGDLSNYGPIDSAELRLGSNLSEKEKLELLRTRIDQTVNDILHKSAKNGAYQRDVLFGLISGRSPLLPAYKDKAAELAAKGWRRICVEGSEEIRKGMAPLTVLLLTHAPMMPPAAHQEVLRSLLAMAPSTADNPFSGKPLFTGQQVANIISQDLVQTLMHTTHDTQDPAYGKNHELLRTMLKSLAIYQTKEQIPLLVALAEEEFKSSLEKDEMGLVNKRTYADGSSRSVERENGQVVLFTFTDKYGNADKWVKNGDSFYKESDLKAKTHPWHCAVDMLPDGDFVIKDAPDRSLMARRENLSLFRHSPEEAFFDGRSAGSTLTSQYGSETIYTKDGAKIVQVGFPARAVDGENINRLWIQETQSDGETHSQIYEKQGEGWIPAILVSTGSTNKDNERKVPQHLTGSDKKSKDRSLVSTNDDLSSLPMPLLRREARSMLARLTPAPLSELYTKADKTFKEQYQAVKLALESGKHNYFSRANENALRQRAEYALLHPENRDAYAKRTANEKIHWWSLGVRPDYATASSEANRAAADQLRLLTADASMSAKDEMRLGRIGQGEVGQGSP